MSKNNFIKFTFYMIKPLRIWRVNTRDGGAQVSWRMVSRDSSHVVHYI